MKNILSFMQEFNKFHHKHWFSQNKKQWKEVRNEFDVIMQDLTLSVSKFDPNIKEAQNLGKNVYKIFRINRDVRFSKDKNPYKRNISGTIALGKMSDGYPGYYLSIEPGNKSFVGGGVFMPDSPSLKRIRKKIDQSPSTLRKILKMKSFRDIFPNGIETDLKVMTYPKGYSKDNPAIDLLRFKSFTAGRNFTDKEVLSENFEKDIIKTLKALYPLQDFLNPQK